MYNQTIKLGKIEVKIRKLSNYGTVEYWENSVPNSCLSCNSIIYLKKKIECARLFCIIEKSNTCFSRI